MRKNLEDLSAGGGGFRAPAGGMVHGARVYMDPGDADGGGEEKPAPRVEVKALDSPEQAVAQIAGIVNEMSRDIVTKEKDADKWRKEVREELSTEIRGLKQLTEEAIRLTKVTDRTKKIRKHAGNLVYDRPISPDREADTALRTISEDAEMRALQEASDNVYILAQLAQRASGMDAQAVAGSQLKTARAEFSDRLSGFGLKTSMDTAESGGGAEWLPTGFSAELWNRFVLDLRVASLFDTFTIPMRMTSFKWPLTTAGATPYLVSEATDYTTTPTVTVSKLTSANREFAPKVLGARVHMTKELSEDSIIPAMPTIRGDIVLALAEGVEDALINGDTATTHQDYDTTVATDVAKAWNGIRKNVHSSAKVARSGTFASSDIFAMLKLMGKWAINPASNAILSSVSAYWQMLAFSEVVTMEKYGSAATIVTGELARFAGLPVVPSEKMRQDINATGTNDQTAANNDKTAVLGVNHRQAKIGMKRGVLLETDYNPLTQQFGIIGTTRLTWQSMFTAAAGTTPFGQLHDITT